MTHALPKLLSGISPLSDLASLPTPVEALTALSPNAFIKRDDLIHAEYGGNKLRKLTCVMAELTALGKKHVVTFGAVGTNHGVATAMVCQQYGLDCTILLFDQDMTEGVKRNLSSMAYYGAKLVYCGSLIKTVARFYSHPRRLDSDYYFLYAGSSTPMGAASFVYAAFELQQQIQQGVCPYIDRIYCAASSGGTVAGLTLGCQLAGLDTEVVGVRVVDSHLASVIPICTASSVYKLMQQAYALFDTTTLNINKNQLRKPIINDDYFGQGYGVATRAGDAATEAFAKLGITLDQTYSAKGAAAFMDGVNKQSTANVPENSLFWMTYNSRDMMGKVKQVSVVGIPEQLRGYF